MAKKEEVKVTPVQLSKKIEVRPQQIFNWIKQGCPSYKIGGKTYVTESEVEEFRNQKDKQRKEKKEKQITRGQVTPQQKEILKLLSTFKAQRVIGFCENHDPRVSEDDYEGDITKFQTTFLVDINYASTDWFGCYVSAWCMDCGLNHRFQDNVPMAIAEEILRGERELWVPITGRFELQFPELAAKHSGVEQPEEAEVV